MPWYLGRARPETPIKRSQIPRRSLPIHISQLRYTAQTCEHTQEHIVWSISWISFSEYTFQHHRRRPCVGRVYLARVKLSWGYSLDSAQPRWRHFVSCLVVALKDSEMWINDVFVSCLVVALKDSKTWIANKRWSDQFYFVKMLEKKGQDSTYKVIEFGSGNPRALAGFSVQGANLSSKHQWVSEFLTKYYIPSSTMTNRAPLKAASERVCTLTLIVKFPCWHFTVAPRHRGGHGVGPFRGGGHAHSILRLATTAFPRQFSLLISHSDLPRESAPPWSRSLEHLGHRLRLRTKPLPSTASSSGSSSVGKPAVEPIAAKGTARKQAETDVLSSMKHDSGFDSDSVGQFVNLLEPNVAKNLAAAKATPSGSPTPKTKKRRVDKNLTPW